jgi:hypothetical protein
MESTMTAPRHNLYTLVHKGLRACMAETLATVGRMDADDPVERAAAARLVRELLSCARSHLEHEERFVHPALEARRSGSSAAAHADHVLHREAFVLLETALRGLECSESDEAAEAALRLYRQLALFVAENFEHMHLEETDNHAVLTGCYDEQDVRAIEGHIIAALRPAESEIALRWMVPAASPAERAALLGGMQQGMPPAAFAAILAPVEPRLSAGERARLDADLRSQAALETVAG